MSNKKESKKRVRLGCLIKPENLEAVKQIKAKTESKSEGVVVDNAIEHYHKHVERKER